MNGRENLCNFFGSEQQFRAQIRNVSQAAPRDLLPIAAATGKIGSFAGLKNTQEVPRRTTETEKSRPSGEAPEAKNCFLGGEVEVHLGFQESDPINVLDLCPLQLWGPMYKGKGPCVRAEVGGWEAGNRLALFQSCHWQQGALCAPLPGSSGPPVTL